MVTRSVQHDVPKHRQRVSPPHTKPETVVRKRILRSATPWQIVGFLYRRSVASTARKSAVSGVRT